MISSLPLLSWTLPVSVKENLDQKNYSNNSNFEGWLFCQNNIDILIIIILVYQLDIRTDFQRNFKAYNFSNYIFWNCPKIYPCDFSRYYSLVKSHCRILRMIKNLTDEMILEKVYLSVMFVCFVCFLH